MLTFLRATAGKSKGRWLSCCMTGVALLDRSRDEASAPDSCGESRLHATSVAKNSCRHELFGLGLLSKAAETMDLTSCDAKSPELSELAQKLPAGRLHA